MKKEQANISMEDVRLPDTSIMEWQVIKDVVINNDNLPNVVDYVKRDYFTSDLRRKTWDRIIELYSAGEKYGIAAIGVLDTEVAINIFSDRLDDSGYLSARQHVMLLRDAAARRRLCISALEMYAASQNPMKEADVYDLLAIESSKVQDSEIRVERHIGDIINDIADRAQSRKEDIAEGRHTRITTGFHVLDTALYNGFAPGNLIILAARPSVGKTALMLNFAMAAARSGAKTVVFSLEMTEEELGNRMLFSTGMVNPYGLANGEVDWPSFEEANGRLAKLPILVNDHTRNIRELTTRITLLRNAGKLDIAYVDYLGLIQSNMDSRTPLTQIIGQITSELKTLAKQLSIPIVLLCQLNRDVVSGNIKSPQLNNLRDSGNIEQDADIVLMLQQEEVPGEDLPNLLVWLRKNRQGRKDFALVLKPNETYTLFTEVNIRE